MKMKKSKKYKNMKQIKRLYEYRKNYANTYKHKVSKVVIRDLKNIKQGINQNKNFVQIPLHKRKK